MYTNNMYADYIYEFFRIVILYKNSFKFHVINHFFSFFFYFVSDMMSNKDEQLTGI